jgi:hypothetical protein
MGHIIHLSNLGPYINNIPLLENFVPDIGCNVIVWKCIFDIYFEEVGNFKANLGSLTLVWS